MSIGILIVMLLAPAASAPAAADEAADRDAVVLTLGAFHAALADSDAAGVLATLGPSFFMANEETAATDSGGPGAGRLSAHMYLAGESLRAWPQAFLSEAGPYRNAFDVQAVSIRGDGAIVVTRDRGRNRFRTWKDEETVWYLGRSDDRWRLVGMVIRDIQLPERPAGTGP